MSLDGNKELTDYTRALLGGVNCFGGDYIKYVEALFSKIEDEDERDSKIEKFLRESKEYYKRLQEKVNSNNGNIIFSEINNFFSDKILKILELIPIK